MDEQENVAGIDGGASMDACQQREFSNKVQEAKEWRVKQGMAPPITGGTWPYSQSTKPTVGWSCPNCGRCYGPHIPSCTNCIGAWPYPGQIAPHWPNQPSPWWQVPPTSPWTYGTVTVPSYAPAAPGSSPSSGTYDLNEYQTRLDG